MKKGNKGLKETEVRFLEIDKTLLIGKLIGLGAEDKGESLLEEVIIYDKDLKWLDERKLIRIRKVRNHIFLTYKHHNAMDKGESVEIEFGIDDMDKAVTFFESLGYVAYRRQQKRRHTLKWNNVTFDFDTWPKIPTYVELEGESVEVLKQAASTLSLDWSTVVFNDARYVIEEFYKIPVGKMTWFTFDRFE